MKYRNELERFSSKCIISWFSISQDLSLTQSSTYRLTTLWSPYRRPVNQHPTLPYPLMDFNWRLRPHHLVMCWRCMTTTSAQLWSVERALEARSASVFPTSRSPMLTLSTQPCQTLWRKVCSTEMSWCRKCCQNFAFEDCRKSRFCLVCRFRSPGKWGA